MTPVGAAPRLRCLQPRSPAFTGFRSLAFPGGRNPFRCAAQPGAPRPSLRWFSRGLTADTLARVTTASKRKTPAALLALGREQLPESLRLDSGEYRLARVFKHDFFAATALYEGDAGKVVLKIGRKASLFGLPLGWIGKLHARHESACYRAVADIEVVPEWLGFFGRHGFVHAYVEGHALVKGERVPDDFFPRLRAALLAMHERKMAYVDLEKCENVLVGDDGKPHLIDFQIAWRWPWKRGGDLPPFGWIRRRLQRADLYHLRKLQRRTRPDQLTEEELRASYAKPWYVRIHGFVTRPFTLLRRSVLNRIDPRPKRGERGRL